MLVVIDANIVISVLISRTGSKQDLLFSDKIKAVCPEFLLFEVGKYWSLICDKSGFEDDDIYPAFSLLRQGIKIVPLEEYSDKISEAKVFCPDICDVEYFALASRYNCPVWSEDKLIRKQDKVDVLNTKELPVKPGLI